MLVALSRRDLARARPFKAVVAHLPPARDPQVRGDGETGARERRAGPAGVLHQG